MGSDEVDVSVVQFMGYTNYPNKWVYHLGTGGPMSLSLIKMSLPSHEIQSATTILLRSSTGVSLSMTRTPFYRAGLTITLISPRINLHSRLASTRRCSNSFYV